MGVGSAVMVKVGDLVGGSVAADVLVGVREGVSVSMPMTAVTGAGVDVVVMVGTSGSVDVD